VAIRFSASDEAIKFTTEPANPWTVTFNFKLTSDRNDWSAMFAVESGDPGANTSGQILVTTDTSGVDLQANDGTGGTGLGVSATVGVWGKCAVSVGNAPNTFIVYVANTLAGALDVNNIGTVSLSGLDRFLFGNNSFGEFIDGVIDNIKIFNSVLSQAQIEAELETRDQVLTPYIHLPMVGADVTAQLADTSGNGRNGTALGTLSIETGAPIDGGGITGSGTGVAGGAEASGAGQVGASISGSGTGAAGGANATGAGVVGATISGSGTGVAGGATASGAGQVGASVTGSGTGAGGGASASGSGQVGASISGSGTGVAGGAAATGTGFHGLVEHDAEFIEDGNGIEVFHYLGDPFPRLARTAWALVTLSAADRDDFLDDCEAKDFTVVEFGAIWRDERTDGVPFANAGAVLPFTNTLDTSTYTGDLDYADIDDEAPDFETPNATYWAFVKAIVDECESRGLLVMLFPCYVGHPVAEPFQGWGREMVANGETKIEAFGAYVGNLFANNGNVIWMLAGDQGTDPDTFDSTELAIQQALHAGIVSANGKSNLFAAEFRRNSTTFDVVGLLPQINVGLSYANSDNINVEQRNAYSFADQQSAVQEEPFDEEGADGNSVNTDATQPCRRFYIWGCLSGIGGANNGNGYVWPFNTTPDDWRDHLDTQTAQDCARWNALWKSLEWWKLLPSQLAGERDLVVAGGGTLDDQDYVAAACADDGTFMLAYVPPGHSGTVTIDPRSLYRDYRARWWDPTDETYTNIGGGGFTFDHTATSEEFTPPGANDEGSFDDWVLVLDTPPDIDGSGTAVAGGATASGAGQVGANITGSGTGVGAGASASGSGAVPIVGGGTAVAGGARASGSGFNGEPTSNLPFSAPGPLQPTFRVLGS
jgi:hypothetical protein